MSCFQYYDKKAGLWNRIAQENLAVDDIPKSTSINFRGDDLVKMNKKHKDVKIQVQEQ